MMIYQDDSRLDRNLNHYGCYFCSLAYYRELRMVQPWTASELQEAWLEAIRLGAISGDLNGDGDLDDAGEAIIVKPDLLCKILGLPLRYRDAHFPVGTTVPQGGHAVTAWHRAGAGFDHFVVGSERPVQYDPIAAGSLSVRIGRPVSMRIYEVI